MRPTLLRALVVLAGATLLLLLLRSGSAALPGDIAGGAAAGDAGVAAAAFDRGAANDDPPGESAAREVAASGAGAPLVRCRLDGLHPDAAWTAAVRVKLMAHDLALDRWRTIDEHGKPDAGGAFAVSLPAWVADAELLTFEFSAIDPLYRPFTVSTDAKHFAGSDVAGPAPFALRVQALAVVRDLVVDADGGPVAGAEITAYPREGGEPVAPQLGHTVTDADGRFVLTLAFAGDAVLHAADPRCELLPARADVALRFGALDLPPLVLRPRAAVTGVVVDADGRPCARQIVMLADDPAAGGEGMPCNDLALTAADGRFRLRGRGGKPARVSVHPMQGSEWLGVFAWRVQPPADVTLVLAPRRLHLDVRADGRPVAAELVVDHNPFRGALRTDDAGTIDLRLATGIDCTLTVIAVGRAPWRRRFAADEDAPATLVVELPPAGPLATLTLQLDVAPPPQLLHCRIDPIGGGPPAIDGALEPAAKAGDGRFQLQLAAGRYLVALRADENNVAPDMFLLPVEQEVVLAPGGTELRLPGALGGRLAIDVTDARGVRPAGRVRVVSSPRGAFAPAFRGAARSAIPGALRTAAPSETGVLPPGRYELALDLGDRGVLRRGVDLRASELAQLRLCLP